MLSVSSYSPEYVASCRAAVGAQVAAFEDLAAAIAAAGQEPALRAFEPVHFNALLLALDHMFVHRGRGLEGKDGNPLNEVRLLCTSLMEHGGVMTADRTIRLKPEASVLGHAPGDPVALREADFRRLAEGFLAEIERRYP